VGVAPGAVHAAAIPGRERRQHAWRGLGLRASIDWTQAVRTRRAAGQAGRAGLRGGRAALQPGDRPMTSPPAPAPKASSPAAPARSSGSAGPSAPGTGRHRAPRTPLTPARVGDSIGEGADPEQDVAPNLGGETQMQDA
jgi:hypothetical protein